MSGCPVTTGTISASHAAAGEVKPPTAANTAEAIAIPKAQPARGASGLAVLADALTGERIRFHYHRSMEDVGTSPAPAC
jgi:hypothetical protein